MIRSDRAVSASSVRESRSWARPTMTASGLLSSWPAPAANSLSASSLRSLEPHLLGFTCLVNRRDDRAKPSLEDRPVVNHGRPASPGFSGRLGEASRGPNSVSVSMAPESDRGAGAPVNFERNDETGVTLSRVGLGFALVVDFVRRDAA